MRMLSVIWITFLCTSILPGCHGGCDIFSTLYNCRFKFPTYKEIKEGPRDPEVIVTKFVGRLTTDSPDDESEEHAVSTLTISDSTITGIEDRFFTKFSAGTLQNLILKSVNGSIDLSQKTLGGLEYSLMKLRAYNTRLNMLDYFPKLLKLKALTINGVGLRKLPDNFHLLFGQLESLDLTENQLTTMPWDAIAKRLEDFRFNLLRLEHNKWICDCRMRPLIDASLVAKNKVTGINCPSRHRSIIIPLSALKLSDICDPNQPESNVTEKPDGEGGNVDQPEIKEPIGESKFETKLATAGGVSTEVIAVIATIVVVFCIVGVALLVFKLRSRNDGRSSRGPKKQPANKDTNYAVVRQYDEPVRHGTFGDDIEKQPLAPPYRADNRL